MGQIIKQKLNRLDKAILNREIAKDMKIEQTIQDLNWRLEQINKTYSYIQGLTEKEIEEYLKTVQKVTKIKDTNKPAETRREYLYEVLSTLNETNDATIWKYRDDIKELQEEYNKDIHGILDITAEEFNDMGLIEQQAAVTALITVQAHCKDEPTKQALYEKHKEFMESQLEKIGEMHDNKEIQGRIYRDVIKARKKEKPQMLLPNPKGRSTYKPYEQYDVPRDKEFVRENKQIRIRISHSTTDDVFLNERLSQASRRNEDIPQGVLPKELKINSHQNQQHLQYTLSRTPTIEIADAPLNRKRYERGYTPSPDPYERKQQRYKSPSLIQGTFKGQTYTTYVPETVYQELEDFKEEELDKLEADLKDHKNERFGQEVENQFKENKGYGINDEEYNHILLNNLTIQQKRKIVPTIIKTEKKKIFSKKDTIVPPITLMSIKILNPQENGIVETPIQLAAKGLAIQQG
ncbi:6317_t:CDS:2 [Dentiscutata erythropus]|uniref:6317_t:CDS:1 n=1 Tax=Dentiscutata erythropus TaxID=1348616 RepID=A0A9N8ZZA2_9GLOM|nr:6317_t:CDS:2 [Dentiscutata erythropus]